MSSGLFIREFRPATYRERGALVPFTSPFLVGARARSRENGGVSFVVPQIDGGHGWLECGVDELLEIAAPTMHDRMLCRALARATSLAPHELARIARELAVTGAAGRVAAKAAAVALEREREETLIARFLLTIGLVAEAGLTDIEWEHLDPCHPELPGWLATTTTRLAATRGCDAAKLATTLDDIAVRLVSVGTGDGVLPGRAVAALEALDEFLEGLDAFSRFEIGAEGPMAGEVAEVARLTARMGREAIEACVARSRDVDTLVGEWLGAPTVVDWSFARADWILDGWGAIAALWGEAVANGRDARRAVIPLIQRLVMVPPSEGLMYEGIEPPDGADIWWQGRWMAGVDFDVDIANLDRVARLEILRAHIA